MHQQKVNVLTKKKKKQKVNVQIPQKQYIYKV